MYAYPRAVFGEHAPFKNQSIYRTLKAVCSAPVAVCTKFKDNLLHSEKIFLGHIENKWNIIDLKNWFELY